MKRNLVLTMAALFAAAMLTPTLRAQDQTAPPDQGTSSQVAGQSTDDTNQNSQAQPTVGHISFIHGNVSIQRADSGDWIAATLNTPIEAGDRVSTGDDSRAEVQLDYANIIRLAQNSTVKVTALTKDQIQVQVGEGLVSYDVLPNSQADAEIDTPNSAVHPLRQGEYRIEIANDSDTEVTVRDGQAEVSEPQGSTRVDSGQLITIQGTDSPQYQTTNAAGPDDFDRWNSSRDQTILNAQSWKHTDRYYTGSQDLDAYGHWESVPDYGQVWVPEQNSGWAPYRDGTWQWEPYYGWTWVSYEPWGWAPYHYGRWFVWGGNWAWWPGPIGVYGGWGYYPVWSPAYVSFFGWGSGVGFGFGFGSIGWLPCGPGDFYNPWWGWGVSRVTFVTVINFHDRDGDGRFGHRFGPLYRGRNGFSNLGRFDRDSRIRAGVTSIRRNEFGHGSGRFERGMSTQQFQHASLMTGRVPAVPTRQSLGRVETRVSPQIARTARANSQHFFGNSRPSFTARPFSEEVSAQQRMIENSRAQEIHPNSRSVAPAEQRSAGNQGFHGSTAQSAQDRTGWHSFGNQNGVRSPAQTNTSRPSSPVQQVHGPQGNASARGGNDAWHRFTPPSGNGGSRGQVQPRSNQFQPNSNARSNWHQFTPPSRNQSRPNYAPQSNLQRDYGRGSPSRSDAYRGYSRPQLNMRQPVVSQRSYGGFYGRPGGYTAPRAGSYGRPSGNFGGYRGGGGARGYRGGGGSRGGGSRGGGHPR